MFAKEISQKIGNASYYIHQTSTDFATGYMF